MSASRGSGAKSQRPLPQAGTPAKISQSVLLASPFVIDSKIGVFNKIGPEAPLQDRSCERAGMAGKRTSAEGIGCATSGGISSVMFGLAFINMAGFSRKLAGKSKRPNPIS
jgi:hypothetical protein